jgi:hypothetical protein
MAVSNLSIFPQKIQGWGLQLTNAIGTTITQLMAAGTNGSVIESMNVSLTDTTANALFVYLQDASAVNHLLGAVTVPISAGNLGTVPAIDVLRSGQLPGIIVDANGDYCLYVPIGFKVMVGANAAPAAGKIMDIVSLGADY